MTFAYEDADDWEVGYNDDKNNATDLTKKTYGTIMTGGDVDYIKYTPSKNGYVNFSFINKDAITDTDGWKITVYDNKLNQIYEHSVKSDDSIGTYIVKKKTPIYLKISYKGSSVITAKYSIKPVFKAANIETEPNDGDADKIKLDKVYCGTLENSKDVDYYKFTAQKTGKYKLVYNMVYINEYYCSYYVAVLDSDKKVISSMQVRENDSFKFEVKKGSTYYIQIGHGKIGTDVLGSKIIIHLYKFKIKTK